MSSRRLYIYFRVRRENEAVAVAALRELHTAWQVAMPGLRCELLRRTDPGADVTLMETYRCENDLNAQWQQRIELEAQSRLAPWLVGERHIERFEPCA